MSATQAAVDVALILGAVVTWVVLWRRDSAQQVQLDALTYRVGMLEDSARRAAP